MHHAAQKHEILVAFGLNGQAALGNVWRITAKRTDFYVDPIGPSSTVHLSVHGPSWRYPDGHRFHVKVPHGSAEAARQEGQFLLYDMPADGYPLDGKELAPGAFLVARIRWTWDLQRERYRDAAASGPAPEIADHQSGASLTKPLRPNDAADLDLVVSYKEPYWPNPENSIRDNSRVGPLRNDADMWLTGTSYRRSQLLYPAPDRVLAPGCGGGETPNRILGGGPAEDNSVFWFVESITSKKVIDAARQSMR